MDAASLKWDAVRIEGEALASFHEVATPGQRRELGLELLRHHGQLLSFCSAERGIMLNRTVGLGVFEAADPDQVDWTIEQFRERNTHRAFIGVTEGSSPPNLAQLFLQRGLTEARAWTKFRRVPSAPMPAPTELRVEPVDRGSARDWGRIVSAGFDMPAGCAEVLARLHEHPGWHLFITYDDKEPAGASGLFVRGSSCWFDWTSTRPGARRRGSQSALMARRIEHARDLGCTRLLTATGEEVPGDPQHSWSNIARAGFVPAFRTRNFALSAD